MIGVSGGVFMQLSSWFLVCLFYKLSEGKRNDKPNNCGKELKMDLKRSPSAFSGGRGPGHGVRHVF